MMDRITSIREPVAVTAIRTPAETKNARLDKWSLVKRAWSIEGNLSYLNQDWR
jgi:hypothetical protein